MSENFPKQRICRISKVACSQSGGFGKSGDHSGPLIVKDQTFGTGMDILRILVQNVFS